ncbi:MAG: hypothetical protein WDN07_03945 [Actinomycetota bacterium]
MIVTIDGVAGAGKTTLALDMNEEYRNHFSIQVIHMDDLYNGWNDPFGTTLLQKLKEIAAAHLAKSPYETTIYNWRSAGPGDAFLIEPVDMLIIEGVGSGHRSIRKYVATKIWIDLDPLLGLERVLAREGVNIESQMRTFLEDQKIHFDKDGTRDAADFHLNGLR